jgi:hypothetical protein
MPDHRIGSNYSLAQIATAYHADPPVGPGDPYSILHRAEEVVALCLRHKHHAEPGEVWVPADPAAALWGERLAQCKAKKTVPLFFAPRGRTFYEFKGQHLVTGDTTDPSELAKRKAPGPLSRVVFLRIANPPASPR